MRQKQQQTHNGKTQNTHTHTHIILANYVKKQVEKENTKKLF